MSGDHWGDYARATQGNPARPLLLEVLSLLEADSPRTPRRALDVGCGAGNDTLELLARGWSVTAQDANAEALALVESRAGLGAALTLRHAPFWDLPAQTYDLVYASLSLPFCPPGRFGETFLDVLECVGRGGSFAASLFGVRDGWARHPETTDMTFLTLDRLGGLLSGFAVPVLREEEGPRRLALGGEHHTHLLTVIARRPEG